jgi:DNA topoisomerase-1
VAEGDRVALKDVTSAQHFTEPPPRYSEATLVKALEEFGIGRPSTYASIISTLRERQYVEMDNRRFVPTDVGEVVNLFLTKHFSEYVDYEFTARMEDSLDAVSRGEDEWVPLLGKFWKPFNERVEWVDVNVPRDEFQRVLGVDPASGRPVSVRMGQYGAFVQIGTKEDVEKPRFAGLRPGQKMYTITLEAALDLFKLPRELGVTAEGEPVSANIGRFGPYVRYANKFVSIKGDDPYTITLERALVLIAEKKIADANRLIKDFPEAGVQVLNGRYGPYITNKAKNAKIPKDKTPTELTLEECQALLAAAPERRGRGMRRKAAPAAADANGETPAAAAKTANAAKAEKAEKPAKKKTKKKKKSTARKARGAPATGAADESPAE